MLGTKPLAAALAALEAAIEMVEPGIPAALGELLQPTSGLCRASWPQAHLSSSQ